MTDNYTSCLALIFDFFFWLDNVYDDDDECLLKYVYCVQATIFSLF